MFPGIRFKEFDPEEFRSQIAALTDAELLRKGKELRALCGKVITPTPCVFDEQLEICREEYRRRPVKKD